MKNNLLLILLIGFISIILCQQAVRVDADYSPLNSAYDNVRQIQMKYDYFRQKIHKNVSLEVQKCEDAVKQMKCNNIDQWQSVIEELKQENANSQNSEIPFLNDRKKMKVERLATVLNHSIYENEVYENITTHLSENQQKIMDAYYYIQQMYKLPSEQTQFSQMKQNAGIEDPNANNQTESNETTESTEYNDSGDSTQNAAQLLNADVPDLAKEQLSMAKKEYEIADESIQAQTAANILKTFNKKMTETYNHVSEAFHSRTGSLLKKKEDLQGDILKVRVMLQNENNIQAKNNERIAKMQDNINSCEGMPTDILKDCDPIKINASKLLTEIDIIQTRTTLLQKHIGTVVEENLSEDQVKQHLQNIDGAQLDAVKQSQLDSYLKDAEVKYYDPKDPNELQPIHHLKDNLPAEEESQSKTAEPNETAQNETVSNATDTTR